MSQTLSTNVSLHNLKKGDRILVNLEEGYVKKTFPFNSNAKIVDSVEELKGDDGHIWVKFLQSDGSHSTAEVEIETGQVHYWNTRDG